MKRLVAALVLAGAISPAVAGKQETVADALAGRVAGKPQRCITLSTSQGPQILDDGTILYRETGSRIWKAQVIGACHVRALDSLIVEPFGSQLCRNDRFRSLRPGLSIPSAYCRFGDFTPYDKR